MDAMTAETPLPGPNATTDELRADLRALRATQAYAFANAHGCSYGKAPELGWANAREADLVARIRELELPS